MTNIKQIIIELRIKAAQYNNAAETLEGLDGTTVTAATTAPKKRTVSASARRKMRKAQKARWARIKAAERNGKPKLVKKAA